MKQIVSSGTFVSDFVTNLTDNGIQFGRGTKLKNTLWGWVDVDWTGDTDTHRSHTGFVLMFNGGPVRWKYRNQDVRIQSPSQKPAISYWENLIVTLKPLETLLKEGQEFGRD